VNEKTGEAKFFGDYAMLQYSHLENKWYLIHNWLKKLDNKEQKHCHRVDSLVAKLFFNTVFNMQFMTIR
jgi:hypothetical protein